MSHRKYSLLYPAEQAEYKTLSQTTMHDLGLDQICKTVSQRGRAELYLKCYGADVCRPCGDAVPL